jgi:CheY-like chemotaxis protein
VTPRPLLVLVAEDDADVREAIAGVLQAEGFRVSLAVDGQHALEELEHGEPPCAVLLDWVMPRVDGEAFLRARAASSALSSVPVFVISATRQHAPDPRVQGFLRKPFSLQHLLPLLRRVCDQHCPEERRERCRDLTEAQRPRSPRPREG